MTHLIDTSVWHKFASHAAVRSTINQLNTAGALFTTCAPVIAEYCFSARNAEELSEMQAEMALLMELSPQEMSVTAMQLQSALWRAGRMRAAGAIDTLIAAYAIVNRQVIVTCDTGFVHIARALQTDHSEHTLSVVYIREDGSVLAE